MVRYIKKLRLNLKISIRFYTIFERVIIRIKEIIGIRNERNSRAIKKNSK